MGLCIHIKGQLHSTDLLSELGTVFARYSSLPDVKVQPVDDQEGELGRYLNNELMDTTGPLKGFIIGIHPSCEPLFFVFDTRGRMACSCKTQFAPLDAHKGIVHLLEEVQPFFAELHVQDEGAYWGTHDEVELLARHDRLAHLIDMVAGAFTHGEPRAEERKGHNLN